MKHFLKIFFLFTLLLFISVPFIFADEDFERELDRRVEEALGDTSELIETVDALINHGLFRNKKAISNLTFDLSFVDRNNLFVKYNMDAALYRPANFWPGFGIGSLAQRDILAFVPHMLFDGAGLLAFAGGGIVFTAVASIDFFVNIFIYIGAAMTGGTPDSYQLTFGPDPYKWSAIIMGSGLGVCLISRLISMIWPGVYAKRYNRALHESLDIPVLQNDISFVPLIDPFNKSLGIAAKIIL